MAIEPVHGTSYQTWLYWGATQAAAVPASATNPVPVAVYPVSGMTVVKEVAPTTTGAYDANDIVGGIIEVETVNLATGRPVVLRSLQVNDKGGSAAAMHIYFFKETPAGGTYADDGNVTWGSGDSGRKVGQVSIATTDWVTDGSQSSVNLSAIDQLLAITNTSLFMLIIVPGTPTINSGSLTLKLGLEQH